MKAALAILMLMVIGMVSLAPAQQAPPPGGGPMGPGMMGQPEKK